MLNLGLLIRGDGPKQLKLALLRGQKLLNQTIGLVVIKGRMQHELLLIIGDLCGLLRYRSDHDRRLYRDRLLCSGCNLLVTALLLARRLIRGLLTLNLLFLTLY